MVDTQFSYRDLDEDARKPTTMHWLMQKSPFPVNVSSAFATLDSEVGIVISFGLKAQQVKLKVLHIFIAWRRSFQSNM